MRSPFEIGEQNLGVESAQDIVYRLLQERYPFEGIFASLEHVIEHQCFIEGGSHLGDQDRIAGGGDRLVFIGIQRVNRVAGFMRYGENILESSLVIQQYIRMYAIDVSGKRAARFAGIFININPAAFEGLRDFLFVIFAQRLIGGNNPFSYVIIAISSIEFNNRYQAIIGVISFQSQFIFAQTHIALDGIGMRFNSSNQVSENIGRDIVTIE